MAILYLVSVAAWRCPAPDPEVLAVLLGHAVPLLGCGGLCPVGREGAICILAVRDGAAVGQLLIDARKINIFDNDTIHDHCLITTLIPVKDQTTTAKPPAALDEFWHHHTPFLGLHSFAIKCLKNYANYLDNIQCKMELVNPW